MSGEASTMKATPRPWMVRGRTGGGGRVRVNICVAPDDAKAALACTYAEGHSREFEANAALIVHAVNNHETLVKTVEDLLTNMKADGGEYRDCYINAAALVASIKAEVR